MRDLPPSLLSLSTPTAQASSVPGLVDGLGIVLERRDKAIMIVTVYFKRNFPPGNPEFKKKKRRSRKKWSYFQYVSLFHFVHKIQTFVRSIPRKKYVTEKYKRTGDPRQNSYLGHYNRLKCCSCCQI